jgi:hypothetical protein
MIAQSFCSSAEMDFRLRHKTIAMMAHQNRKRSDCGSNANAAAAPTLKEER